MNEQQASSLKGKFIVFDGPDGAGKTTQRGLLAKSLEDVGVATVCCRDPGGTEIGDRIRSVLLDYDLSQMNVSCETMLFMASRAQLLQEVIKPALEDHKTVLCDRFVTATCAYQGAAGYDPNRAIELARFAIEDSWPDVTVILDVNAEEGFSRTKRKASHVGKNRKSSGDALSLFDVGQTDAMEARSLDFHRRVRKMFLKVQDYYPTPVVHVDGRGDEQTVHNNVVEAIVHVTG